MDAIILPYNSLLAVEIVETIKPIFCKSNEYITHDDDIADVKITITILSDNLINVIIVKYILTLKVTLILLLKNNLWYERKC